MTAVRLSLLAPFFLLLTLPIRAEDDETARHEATLKQAGVGTDGATLVAFFRKRTPNDEERKRLAEARRQLGDEDFETREKASRDLIAAGRAALPLLRPAFKSEDVEVVRRARACVDEIERLSEVPLVLAAAGLIAARKPDGGV